MSPLSCPAATAASRQRGAGLFLLAVFLFAIFASLAAIGMSTRATQVQRQRITERALAHARESLLAYAAERPIDAEVGPGYLPCPDTDDDGWAEATCGSLPGHLGQADRLGRLPWKTLGLPDLRDGSGERLWYAVSSKHKGLLNCAASRDCRDLTPVTGLGTITLRDTRGKPIHDGTLSDIAHAADGGAVAIVIAPGPPIQRADGREQRRACTASECDATGRCMADPPQRAARCDPLNYLDVAPASAGGEDNAAFVDRNDAAARWRNRDGFIQGPIVAPDGTPSVNDRIVAVGYADLMPRVMNRVALEASQCLRLSSALPDPTPTCGNFAGRLEAAGFPATACNLKADEPAWWTAWKPFIVYARAAPAGLEVVDEQGRPLATHRRFALIALQSPGQCPAERLTCAEDGCTRVATRPRGRDHPDAIISIP